MKKINLISGEFAAVQARDLLLEMFHKNINFNKIQNFSSQVRFGNDDNDALDRIKVLQEGVEIVNVILKEAQSQNKSLKIKSSIEIEYVE